MFSTCSELTPRAPIPDGRMERFMHPCAQILENISENIFADLLSPSASHHRIVAVDAEICPIVSKPKFSDQ